MLRVTLESLATPELGRPEILVTLVLRATQELPELGQPEIRALPAPKVIPATLGLA